MKIKEIVCSSKRSINVRNEYFTFECSETVDVSDVSDEEIEKIKLDIFDRCNQTVDDQCDAVRNM